MMKTYLRYSTLTIIALSPLMAHAMSSPDPVSPKAPECRPCCSPCSFDKSLAQRAHPNAPREDQIAYAHGRSLLAILKQLYTARMVYDQLVQKQKIAKDVLLQFQEELAYCQDKISSFLGAHEPINFNVCDSDGKTILILAAITNQHSLINDLLDDKLVDIDQMDKQGFTALLRAIEYGCVGSVQLLLHYNAIFPVLCTDCDCSQERIEQMLREKYAARKNSSN